jgi:RNA polymerase sigma-70 factor (ECF subfamily)
MSSSAARYFPELLKKTSTSSPAHSEDVQAAATGAAVSQGSTVGVSAAATSASAASDEDLIALICEGDKEALSLLFRRYARIVRGVAYRILGDTAEADDLLQDVLLRIHRYCKAFDSSKSPAQHWILKMTYRCAISRRRYLDSRHFYQRVDLDDVAKGLAEPSARTGCYEDSIDGVLGNGSLEKMFDELSEGQRQTLHLYFFEGYTFAEIAAKLDQTRGNVKHHYFRGLEKLRKQIFGSKLTGK